MQKRLNIGIGLVDLEVSAWTYRLIERIKEEGIVDIQWLFLIAEPPVPPPPNWLSQFHMTMDQKYFKPGPDAFERKLITSLIPAIQTTTLPSSTAPTVDLIIWLGDRDVPVTLFQQSRKGVWYYQHGADGKSTKDSLGYQEFMQMTGVIRSALHWQPSEQAAGHLIMESWSMMPSLSMSRGRNEHFWKILSFVPRALKQLAQDRLPIQTARLNTTPATSNQLSSVLPLSSFSALINMGLHTTRMLHKAWRKLNFREQWILLAYHGQSPSRSFKDFNKLYPPKSAFWADPFLIRRNNRNYLFFEELLYETDKGHISVMEIDDNGQASAIKRVLETPYHLSYPFLFEYDDRLYMIPESYQANCIQVFECTDFPHRWEARLKLMDEVCAMDTTLFYYNNKWWLFTAITENPGASHHDELFLFYADEPLTTQWTPHPQNPIVSDVRSARPAGNLYMEGGILIRPSQDSTRKYGFGFNLNKVEVLNEQEYRETRILHVRPDWSPEIERTHSYVHQEGITVIDGLIQRKKR